MFELTFLGHQGWLLSTATTNLLIDPLLGDHFGHGGLLGDLYPPRTLDLARFPPIDAVILSHEHDDHFDLPSLNRLDRRIPIYLSSRSSSAARGLLDEMGFARVNLLAPDDELEIGELRYRSFVAEHDGAKQGDEWDVFPFLVRDRGGHGSLWSSVDVRPRDADLAQLRALAPRPGVWAYANNCSRASFQTMSRSRAPDDLPASDSDDTPLLAAAVARRHAQLEASWGRPVATLICGAGWSFPGPRAWMNHHLFPVDSQRLAASLANTCADRAVAPHPGHTLVLRDGELIAERSQRPFIQPRPRATWPARDHRGAGPQLVDYRPACGRTPITAAERELLLDELVDFARYLYGTPLFCQLHSLPTSLAADAGGEVRAQLCLSLRCDDGPLVLRYEPHACRFEVCAEGLRPTSFASGLECWASDLLGFLRGELGASALCYAGRLRVWNHAPKLLRVSPRELWMYGSPLRRPERAARLYRRLLAAEADPVPRVPARESS
ncbi:Beta-lactamase superfamily domain protein [Enhygromyxa salina]|uniref:Beta-lactamase superfamily domain protein n=1 Tax=Enhygromyxa salina TaxID=215803 RepID=A0A2S9XHJ4_9BACT|nr:MBL fold metallo-hydrolase [Enhygromyxa salina]PRP92210.1 Beta-lactamase superfamily domain protein [Enhygromyxa salina]